MTGEIGRRFRDAGPLEIRRRADDEPRAACNAALDHRRVDQRADRGQTAARRYFQKAIEQNGELETITVDKSGANLAALDALNAGCTTPVKVRQNKYLNNLI